VAIDHFPSLLPRESSTRFADDSTPHLLKLTQVCFDYLKIHQLSSFSLFPGFDDEWKVKHSNEPRELLCFGAFLFS